jgi:hypothetical protein
MELTVVLFGATVLAIRLGPPRDHAEESAGGIYTQTGGDFSLAAAEAEEEYEEEYDAEYDNRRRPPFGFMHA